MAWALHRVFSIHLTISEFGQLENIYSDVLSEQNYLSIIIDNFASNNNVIDCKSTMLCENKNTDCAEVTNDKCAYNIPETSEQKESH